jgi:outer membrane protein W
LSIFGGAHYVLSYGSEDDYSPGENDFPVTPAHAAPVFGLSATHRLSGRLAAEIDGRFAPGSEVTLTDPSDGDTVKVDTLRRLTATVNVLLFLGRGAFRPYILAGAGADILVGAEEQTLTTELGYDVTFSPPEKKVDPTVSAGFGALYFLGPSLGLRLDARYVLLPKSGSRPSIHGLSAAAGLTLRVL